MEDRPSCWSSVHSPLLLHVPFFILEGKIFLFPFTLWGAYEEKWENMGIENWPPWTWILAQVSSSFVSWNSLFNEFFLSSPQVSLIVSASKGLTESPEWMGARAACDTCLDFLSLLPKLPPSAFPPESPVLFLFSLGALSLQLSPTCFLIFYLSLWLFSTETKTWSCFTPRFLLMTLLRIPASIVSPESSLH